MLAGWSAVHIFTTAHFKAPLFYDIFHYTILSSFSPFPPYLRIEVCGCGCVCVFSYLLSISYISKETPETDEEMGSLAHVHSLAVMYDVFKLQLPVHNQAPEIYS